ncbi:MAG: GntR family transcriptional regulator [Lentisphaeria bacterium]|nr:GntR family transcriptional regulator [Lentisphaeria bacterium]
MELCKRNAVKRKTPCVYAKLYHDISEAVLDGRLAPGSALFSEQELAEKYKISRTSVRSGLHELRKNGFIEKRPGKGSFICRHTLRQNTNPTYSLALNASLQSDDFWYGVRISSALTRFCAEQKCHCILTTTDVIADTDADAYMLLLMPENSDLPLHLSAKGKPSILFNRINTHEKVAYVSVDYRLESRKAIQFLLDRGAHKILIPDVPGNQTQRHLGMADALQDSPGSAIFLALTPPHNLEQQVQQIREAILTHAPDSIYLINASRAVPVLNVLQELNQNIPVVCFDDITPLKSIYRGTLYSVCMPLEQMVQDAADYLIAKLQHGSSYPVLKKLYKAVISE